MYDLLVDTYFLGGFIVVGLYLYSTYQTDNKIITEDIILSMIFFFGGWVTIPTLILIRIIIWVNNNPKKTLIERRKH